MDDILQKPEGLDEFVDSLPEDPQFSSDATMKTSSLDQDMGLTGQNIVQDTGDILKPEGLDDFLNTEESKDIERDILEEQYGSLDQQALAVVEGAAEGLLGPLAPAIEADLLGVSKEDILARRQINPIAHTVGQAGTLAAGMATGVGVGGALNKAGQAVAKAAGLAAPRTALHKVGSSAVKEAVEGALFESSNEVSKMVLNDPSTTAETALTNVGLGAVLGGVAGGALGSISPLWKATAGPKTEQMLSGIRAHLDGDRLVKPSSDLAKDLSTLGVEVDDVLKAAVYGDKAAIEQFKALSYAQNPEALVAVKNLRKNTEDAIIKSIGSTPEDIIAYSPAQSGRNAMNTLKDEYRRVSEPISKEFNDLVEPFKAAEVNSLHKAELGEKIADLAAKNGWIGSDIPQDKLVNAALNRVEGLNSAEDFKKLITVLGNIASENPAAFAQPARKIISTVMDVQQNVIGDAIETSAPKLMDKYRSARQRYAQLANMSQELADELNLGRFKGPESLLKTLESKRTPEQFLSKLSPSKNAELLIFLSKNFPSTLESIRKNELDKVLKSSVLRAGKDQELNIGVLRKSFDKMTPEMRAFTLSEGLAQRLDAAERLINSIPTQKDSGTPGGIAKLLNKFPQSALAAVAALAGNSPILNALSGYAAGEVMQRLGRDVPDAMRVSYLKYLASDQPIKAEGFASMMDYLSSAYKGENLLGKAVKGVFDSSKRIALEKLSPNIKSREKLDKQVSNIQTQPLEVANRLADNDVGYYLPEHQEAMTASATRVLMYLSTLKPHPQKKLPLDKETKPSASQTARYNRALDIAQQPLSLLPKIQSGTLLASDVVDLKSMYPQMYTRIRQKLSDQLLESPDIPYKARISLSLFMAQPLDSTMTPASIRAAQTPAAQTEPSYGKQDGTRGRSMKAVGDTVPMYETSLQKREANKD